MPNTSIFYWKRL